MSRSRNSKSEKVSVSQRKTLVSPSRKVSIIPFATPIIYCAVPNSLLHKHLRPTNHLYWLYRHQYRKTISVTLVEEQKISRLKRSNLNAWHGYTALLPKPWCPIVHFPAVHQQTTRILMLLYLWFFLGYPWNNKNFSNTPVSRHFSTAVQFDKRCI